MKVIIGSICFFLTQPLAYAVESACNRTFLESLTPKVSQHFCEMGMHPGCGVARNEIDQVKLSDSAALVGGAVTVGKIAKDSWVASTALQKEKMKVFSAYWEDGKLSDRYFLDKLYGRDPYAHIVKKPLYQTSRLRATLNKMGLFASAFSYVYFSYDESDARCGDTLLGQWANVRMVDGRCVPQFSYSDRVLKFLSLPIDQRLKLAQSSQDVCGYYLELNKRIDQILFRSVQLRRVDCVGDKPQMVDLQFEGRSQRLKILENSSGRATGFTVEDIEKTQAVAVRFRDVESIDQVEFRDNKGEPKTVSAGALGGLATQPERGQRLIKSLQVWWTAQAQATACCSREKGQQCPLAHGRPESPSDASPAILEQE